MCTKVAGDDYVWETKVPELSLQYGFLLNGLFALSAFEIAYSRHSECACYVRAAINYQALALNTFRKQLEDAMPDSFEPLLCFSMMLMVLALASAQFTSGTTNEDGVSMVQNAITHYELLRGCTMVLARKADYLAENPYAQKLKPIGELPRAALAPNTEAAIAKLNTANERRIAASVGESYECRVAQVSHWEACKKAIYLLHECFAKCVDNDYKGYALGWLNLAGDDYIKAVKANDCVALSVLAFWGVLIEKLSNQVWWAKDFGGSLVEDISSQLLNQGDDELTGDIIVSAREHIRALKAPKR